jgi:AmmeMemoRadiSam system protein B
MEGEAPYPKMRGVDIFPAEVSGQKVICLRDPLNLSGKILFVPYATFFILSLLDGQHSVVEIQTEFMRRFGELLYRETVEALMGQLDEHFLLENERFRQAESRMVESFKRSRVRPMALAGESYEGDGQKLKDTLASFFVDSEGPGVPHGPDGSIRLSGAIAPHIDYRRGGPCYAWAHRQILESPAPDLFIILGTAHSPMKRPFALTRKHFQTPWGPVETDQAFLSAVEGEGGRDFYEDEWVHKNEHSIELQLIFLRAFWERPDPLRVVPILCGSFHEAVQNQMSPGELPGVAPFIEALKSAIARREKRVCFLASADLAHVGLRFGDPDPPDRFILQNLVEEDRRLLGYAERVDAEGFFGLLSREGDRRRVCGMAPIYILLRLLEGTQGRLLKYSQSLDPASQSVVTFASLAYFAVQA